MPAAAMSKAVADEIAIQVGAQSLVTEPDPPYGCGVPSLKIPHDPAKGLLADLVRAVYLTRRTAEDLAHLPMGRKVTHQAAQLARYANSLEFVGRQAAMAMRMPVGVYAPYLPLDVACGPSPLVVAAAARACRPGGPRRGRPDDRGVARSMMPSSSLRKRKLEFL
uniref:Uncharacterized protein n=1 Tax=Zooxanthella nutricula TaxID=1333877 RepID=A0A7S2LMN2_9DINO|mmetsp:Transcript_62855/g.192254  ORF Transcript_62855/g.192254 Transcript_62855/m.192254 type:complete len:165 (+) Transcript_62855:3-497(+)